MGLFLCGLVLGGCLATFVLIQYFWVSMMQRPSFCTALFVKLLARIDEDDRIQLRVDGECPVCKRMGAAGCRLYFRKRSAEPEL